jgi:xylulokinase
LLDDVALELGLPKGIPVVGGGGDAVVQAIGTGVLGPGILGTTIGTAGNVAMSLDKCHENSNGRLQIFCSNVPDKWVVMGVTLAAGGSLSWFGQIWEPEEGNASRIQDDVYEILMREAAAVSPGSEGLIFLPYLMGERSPHVDPAARGAFIGLTQRHTKKHFVRSILEGVIFSLKDVSELIHAMGMPWSEIRTSGGAARSKLWKQIHADVFNEEVTSMKEAAEGAAFGAAILAGVGIGVWSSVEEIAKELSTETKIEPVPENVAIYEILFSIYRDLYPSLQSIFYSISATYQ